MDVKPFWVQSLEFLKAVKGTNESFEGFWARKSIMKENCKLKDHLTTKDLDVLELLRRVHSDKIQKEMLWNICS